MTLTVTNKIFRGICTVTLVSVLLALFIIIGISYSYFDDRLTTELSSEARYVSAGVEQDGLAYLESLPEGGTRITWIGADGTVIYDSVSPADAMDNHISREEIQEALSNGSGSSVRYSGTLSERTVYYAVRLTDGSVLRVSSSRISVWTLVMAMLQPLIFILAITVFFALFLAYRISRRIVEPINKIDLENPGDGKVYDELSPLVSRIKLQNRLIKRQISQLEKKQNEFNAITGNMSEGFLIIDSRADILSYNASALRMLGASEAGNYRSVLSLNRSESFRNAIRAALSGNRSEGEIHSGDRIYRIIANPVSNNEETAGAVIVILDETEKEKREALRREFTSNVSHELRTPLTSISGFAELMMKGLAGEEDCAHFSANIYTEAQRLITLVNDILRLSQLDDGAVPYDTGDIDLSEVCTSVVARLSNVAAAQDVSLSFSGSGGTVSGNRGILEEMVYNLVDNGIKYNKKGGRVSVSVTDADGQVRLSVSDTGIGIPKDQTERVFERFYRVDKSHSKEIGGTGLGLSIVKHAAAYHGAKIQMESELGVGTTVTVTFPAAKRAPAEQTPAEQPASGEK